METPQKTAIKTTYISILSNGVLAVIKWITGILGNSYALIADAIESTADILASILVLLGFKYAQKPADENHPYGHGRIEPLVTFAIVGFLIASATVIAVQSIQKIQTPHELPKPWTLVVLAVIIIWKEISFQWVNRKSKETKSSALKAEAWHHRADAVTSITAFIGISIALFMGEGYEVADDYAALAASGLILYNSYKIFRPALGEIMDEHLYPEMVAQIRRVSLTVPGVLDTEKCLVRKQGMEFLIDLHAIVDGDISVKAGHDISHQLKDKLMATMPEISNVLIHIEPQCDNFQH